MYMQIDKYGQMILSENDILDAIMRNHDIIFKGALVEYPIIFNESLDITNKHEFIAYDDSSNIEISEFDKIQQHQWFMPSEYQNLDIAEWVLAQCKTDIEIERVGIELIMFFDRNLFSLLTYLKYLVDTMRKNNIVWGVGRGSSVSSYVLYLIGVHRIDSIKFKLDINEFLR